MGRIPINKVSMSDAERQRRRRARLKSQGMEYQLVNKDLSNGYFSISERIARAVQSLSLDGDINEELINKLINKAIECMPTRNLIDSKYLYKELTKFIKNI